MTRHKPLGSRKLAGFGTTIFTEMTALATKHGAVNLAQGFPDFDGPETAKEAARDAIAAGAGQYARAAGLPALCEAVAASYEQRFGMRFAADSEITIGCGVTEHIFAAVQAFCDVGDEVVLFEPFYDSYRAAVVMAGASARVVALRAPTWHFDVAELARAFSARTRLVIVNTPHNPTGKVFSVSELDAIAALCCEHDVICLADEVYEHIVYEGVHVPMASRPGMAERTVTLSGISKTYSLTGWRVGWAAASAPLSAVLRAAHQFITFAAPTPLQHAAAVALASPAAYYDELRAVYRRRRDLLACALDAAGFDVYPTAGAYFLCAGIARFGFADDVAFCRFLVNEIGVAAIPPSAFYDHTELGASYVRFVFCKREETLAAAAERLTQLPARLASRLERSGSTPGRAGGSVGEMFALQAVTPARLRELVPTLTPIEARKIVASVHRDEPLGGYIRDVRKLSIEAVRDLAHVPSLEVRSERASALDPFRKVLLGTHDGHAIESVRIPLERAGRFSACVSSQVGCALACAFCATGRMGLVRNLEAWEIVEQVRVIRRTIPTGEGRVHGIVFQGMGEPLANADRVIEAIRVFSDPCALAIDARSITVCTSGLPAGIRRLANEAPRVRLAISIGSARPDVRRSLMPIDRAHSLDEVLDAAVEHARTTGHVPLFAITPLAGVNDTDDDARAFAARMHDFIARAGLRPRVSLVPYNSIGEGDPFKRADADGAEAFRAALIANGVIPHMRYSGGSDVAAACGQLAALG